MSLIIARFLLSRLEKPFRFAPSLPNLPRAGKSCLLSSVLSAAATASAHNPAQPRPARLCALFRSAIAPLHKPHRLAVARISPVASYCLVPLSTRGGKTLISRLNLLPPPPAAPGRACLLCHLCPASASAHADAKSAHKYHRPKRIRTLRCIPSLTLISRPMVVPRFIHIQRCGSPGRTSFEVPLNYLCA